MEGPEAAYAQGDLYADVMAAPTTVIPSNGDVELKPGPFKPGAFEYKSYTTVHPKSVEQQEKETKIRARVDKQERHGKQFYVGGLTWWTNDAEVTTAIKGCGVHDIISIKFAENRINGQSKGYCTVELESEASVKLCMGRLPNTVIHNQRPSVTNITKHTTQMFENQARKDIPGLAGSDKRMQQEKSKQMGPPPSNGPQIIQGLPPPGANVVNAPPGVDPNMMQQQQAITLHPGGVPPGSIIVDAMGNVIQGSLPPQALGQPGPPHGMPPGMFPGPHGPHGHPVPHGPPGPHHGPPHHGPPHHGPPHHGPPHHGPPGHMGMPPRPPGVAPHINPAFMPPDAGPPIDPMTGLPLQTAGLSEADMESMRRNQAVASTAIQRAMTDANAGEFESGIETLVTAISLIKQSTTANTEPAQVLVQSLQDCLQGLEGQLVQKGSGHRDSDRYDRDRRRRRDRSRSRSRSRSRERRRHSPKRSRSRDRRRR